MVVMKFGILIMLIMAMTPIILESLMQKKKIAYAASIGRSNYLTLGQEMKSEITKLLQGFSKISVRDISLASFFNSW